MTTCEQCGAAIPRPDVLAGARDPNSFCTGCGGPYPWATREDLIRMLRNLVDSQGDGVSPADRLELMREIEVLSLLEEDDDPDEQVRIAEKIKRLAPKAWAAARPLVQTLVSAEIQRRLGLPS